MHEIINEPIEMLVAFKKVGVIPRQMFWSGRLYEIKQINMIHTVYEGTKHIFYFSVSNNEHAFKLRFDTELLKWTLAEMYTDG